MYTTTAAKHKGDLQYRRNDKQYIWDNVKYIELFFINNEAKIIEGIYMIRLKRLRVSSCKVFINYID